MLVDFRSWPNGDGGNAVASTLAVGGGFYYRRVTVPVSFRVACGQPAAFRPALQWWQPFVFSYLNITGWVLRHRREPPV
jgi:hypothetical protein